jgi:hypothetical protein
VAEAAGGDHCRFARFGPPVTVNAVGAPGAATVTGGERDESEEDESPQPENDRAVRQATANMETPDTNRCQREGSDLYDLMINLR